MLRKVYVSYVSLGARQEVENMLRCLCIWATFALCSGNSGVNLHLLLLVLETNSFITNNHAKSKNELRPNYSRHKWVPIYTQILNHCIVNGRQASCTLVIKHQNVFRVYIEYDQNVEFSILIDVLSCPASSDSA